MKNKIASTAIALSIAFSTTACSGSNEHGDCIGIIEEGDPELTYNISVWNTVWSVLFFGTVLAPVFWATDYAKCPTGHRVKRGLEDQN